MVPPEPTAKDKYLLPGLIVGAVVLGCAIYCSRADRDSAAGQLYANARGGWRKAKRSFRRNAEAVIPSVFGGNDPETNAYRNARNQLVDKGLSRRQATSALDKALENGSSLSLGPKALAEAAFNARMNGMPGSPAKPVFVSNGRRRSRKRRKARRSRQAYGRTSVRRRPHRSATEREGMRDERRLQREADRRAGDIWSGRVRIPLHNRGDGFYANPTGPGGKRMTWDQLPAAWKKARTSGPYAYPMGGGETHPEDVLDPASRLLEKQGLDRQTAKRALGAAWDAHPGDIGLRSPSWWAGKAKAYAGKRGARGASSGRYAPPRKHKPHATTRRGKKAAKRGRGSRSRR